MVCRGRIEDPVSVWINFGYAGFWSLGILGGTLPLNHNWQWVFLHLPPNIIPVPTFDTLQAFIAHLGCQGHCPAASHFSLCSLASVSTSECTYAPYARLLESSFNEFMAAKICTSDLEPAAHSGPFMASHFAQKAACTWPSSISWTTGQASTAPLWLQAF